MEKEIKYPIKSCTHKLSHSNQNAKDSFKDNFDTYNLFLFEIEQTMRKFGVASIDITLSEHLLEGHPTF
jgi:hypothetical protein